jgi:HEPN domain-containing protein
LSPSPEQVEYGKVLLCRATDDAHACRVLVPDTEVGDSIIGFHAQQAVEKALKVALVLADSEMPRTHDLELLVEQVEGTGTEVPDELSSTEWLTPWAAEFRYDVPVPLDRAQAVTVAETAIAWAESLLADCTTTDSQGSIQGSALSKSGPAKPDPTPDTLAQLDAPSATS